MATRQRNALGLLVKPAARTRGPARKRARRSGPTFIQRGRSESSEQKAIWHNVTGAGRAHVKRPFFDVNESDKVALRDALERAIDQRLKAAQ